MKKKAKVIFGVASGLSFVGLAAVGWFQLISDRMESVILGRLNLAFAGGCIVCLLVFATLMWSDCDPNEGGSIPPGGPGIPW